MSTPRPLASTRVNATTTEQLTIKTDNGGGEPLYVRTLPDRHNVHPGKTVLDVFRHDGYWFTVPGDFPACVPEEYHLTRATYAVFQSPEIVAGALVWVVRGTGADTRNLATSTESRRTAVRQALSRLASIRTERARQIMESRAASVNEDQPLIPVRVEANGGRAEGELPSYVLHVRCLCKRLPAQAAAYHQIGDAAADYLTGTGDAWRFCESSPKQITTDTGTAEIAAYSYGMHSGELQPILSCRFPDGRSTFEALSSLAMDRL
ncbi:hypothetical protein ABZ864_40845 [Streptomyces sp. NPDC047082]|uniref:hypothetical protein n=1 Tax=Streptomyces sp. NPDC047082 TaxID=3155259 RepID=UPI0033DA7190